jgi:hypothetical protein
MGKASKIIVTTFLTFVASYIVICVLYIVWFMFWGSKMNSVEPIPIFLSAIPVAVIGAIIGGTVAATRRSSD